MAYGDNTVSAVHRWSFQNVLTDSIGLLNLTSSGTSFSTPITRDGSNSLLTDGRDDRAFATPISTSGGGSTTSRFAVGGWFKTNSIQGPPCLIYKQGGGFGIALFIWGGNNLTAQCKFGAKTIQIYSDIALTNDRVYHFLMVFEGSDFGNEFSFYIDGVKQVRNNGDVTIGQQYLDAHSTEHSFGENGAGSTDVQVGGSSVIVKACVNGFYSEWWIWFALTLTQAQINEDVFGAGAIPEVTITADTEANMQSALNAASVNQDAPLVVLVEEVSGGGDLNLNADGKIFNSRSSIHVRYEGAGNLFWTNSNGSNATRTSGNVTVLNPAQLTLNGLKNPTEVRIYEAGTQNEVAGQEDVISGTYSDTISISPIDVVLLSLEYKNLKVKTIDISNDLTIDVTQFVDRQYKNL